MIGQTNKQTEITILYTVVGDYINTMKTTFEFNINSNQAMSNSMNTQKTYNCQENLSIKKASL